VLKQVQHDMSFLTDRPSHYPDFVTAHYIRARDRNGYRPFVY